MLTSFQNPYGFISPKDEAHQSVPNGDVVVSRLLEHFRKHSVASFASRKLVIEAARRLFRVTEAGEMPGLKSFMLYQLHHADDHFSSAHYQFLIDTIKFIRTGHRRVHVVTTMSIIEGYNREAITRTKGQLEYLVKLKNEALTLINSLTVEEDRYFLSTWLRHEQGMSDLLYSLIVLFGGKKNHDVEPYVYTVNDFME